MSFYSTVQLSHRASTHGIIKAYHTFGLPGCECNCSYENICVFSSSFFKIHMQLYYITVLVSVIERFNNYVPVSQVFRFSVFTIAQGRQPQGAQAPMNI